MDEFNSKTTDELLDLLPNNLHVTRNDNAPEHDRWRIYNVATGKYPEPGYPTARELLIGTLTQIEKSYRAWVGG